MCVEKSVKQIRKSFLYYFLPNRSISVCLSISDLFSKLLICCYNCFWQWFLHSCPKNENNLKKEETLKSDDNHKTEDNVKKESNFKNQDNFKNEEDLKLKITSKN